MSRAREQANLSSDSNIFVDIANDRTGIGVTTPSQKLEIAGNIKLGDNQEILIGTGSDLKLWHDGSHSYVRTTSGTQNLYLQTTNGQVILGEDGGHIGLYYQAGGTVELRYNNIKTFETVSGGSKVTGNLEVTGNIALGDDDRILFGDSGVSDAHVRYDGSHLQFGVASGTFRVSADGVTFVNYAGTETLAVFNNNGSNELYHNNSKKFETSSTGATLNGVLTTTQLNVTNGLVANLGGNGYDIKFGDSTSLIGFRNRVRFGDGEDMTLFHNGSHSYITNATGNLLIQNDNTSTSEEILIQAKGDEHGIRLVANGPVELYYDGAIKLTTEGTAVKVFGLFVPSANDTYHLGIDSLRWQNLYISNDIDILDNGKLLLGTGDDLSILHNGSHSFVKHDGTGMLKICSNMIDFRNAADNATLAYAQEGNKFELFYAGSSRFETTNTGAKVTGNLEVTGVLTYDDVTNIDSVGIVTARTGIHIDDSITHIGDTNTKIRFPSADTITAETGGTERLRIASDGVITATQPNSAIGLIVKNSAHNSQLQILATASNKNSEIWFGDAADGNIGKIDYDHNNNSLAFTVNTSERLRINSSGQVSIGNNPTVASDAALHIELDGTREYLRLEGDGGTSNAYLELEAPDNRRKAIIFKSGGTRRGVIGVGDSDEASATSLFFSASSNIAGNSPHMVIDSSGYVGVNVTPSTRLDVKQNNGVAYNNRAQTVSYGAARFLNESGHTSGGTYTGFQFNITGDSQNRICAIGMISEASNSRASSLVFATDDNGNRTEKLRITSDGKFGFGTNSPTSLLHVSGGSSPTILNKPSDATPALFVGDSNRSGNGQHLAEFRGNWNGTLVSRMVFSAGDDTTNKDNGNIDFYTAAAGSTALRLRIASDGMVTVGNDHSGAASYGGQMVVATTTGGVLTLADTGSGERLQIEGGAGLPRIGTISSNHLAFFTNGTDKERFRIAQGSAGTCTILFGGVTNDLNKSCSLSLNHYTYNTYNQIDLIKGSSTSGSNLIEIGGSGQGANTSAATTIKFFTAANATTNNGTERLRIDSGGRLFTGASTQLLDSTAGTIHIDGGTSGGRIALRGTTTSAGGGIGEIFAFWNNNKVAGIIALAGSDTSNKDDGHLTFYTRPDVATGVQERLRITSTGLVTNKGTWTNTYAANDTTQCGYQAQNLSDTTNTYAALRLTAGNSSPATAQIASIRTGTGQNDLTIQLETGNTAFEALRIKSDGNLGIARNNPSYRLHIHTAATNSTQVTGLCIANDASSTGVGAKINLGAGNGFDSTSAGISGWYDGTGTSLSLFTTASYASTGHVERLRITSGGKILGGNQLNDRGAVLQIESSDHAMIGIHRNTADHGAPAMNFSASRGTSAGANNLVQDDDYLGMIRFAGADGSDLASGAYITGIVDGTAASNVMPTRLGFWTALTNESPVEHLRITSAGIILAGTTTAAHWDNRRFTIAHTGDTFLELRGGSSNGCGILFTDGTGNNASAYTGYIFYSHADNSMRFHTNDGIERLRIDSTGDVRFAGNNLTNNTNKNVNLTAPSYNTSEEDVNLVQVENESGMNQISFGGGTSGLNAATTLRFLTASAVNTTTGTERMRIASDGEIFMGANFGTTNRSTLLSISGANQDPAGVWTQVGIYADGGQAANKGGSIGFGGPDGSASQQQFAAIKGAKENATSGNYAGYMAFYTRPSGAVSVERLRIESWGTLTASQGPSQHNGNSGRLASGHIMTWNSTHMSGGLATGWYPIIHLTDGCYLFMLKTGAHSSILFTASNGYDPSNVSYINVLHYTSNRNGSYLNVDGLRATSDGVIEVHLTASTSSYFYMEAQILGAENISSSLGFYATLTKNTGSPTVNDTKYPLTYSTGAMQLENVRIDGTLSKNAGSFRIPHPLPALKDTKDLSHSFIEGPQCDNIYRGKIDLVGGTATVNLDTKSNMTEGTFVVLNRDVQCYTTNETGWTNVKGSVSGNTLTITAQDNSCTDTISWMVVGERQDDSIKSERCALTDDNGSLIVEQDRFTNLGQAPDDSERNLT